MTEMNAGEARSKTPVHLWVVGVLTLIWNSMGAFDYLATQLELESYMSQYSEAQLAYFYGFPTWVVAFWAIAVWSAFVGSIFLLMRKKWTVCAFAISIAGMCVTTIYNFGMTNGAEVMGWFGVFFSVAIWVISIFVLVYAWMQKKRGVLS